MLRFLKWLFGIKDQKLVFIINDGVITHRTSQMQTQITDAQKFNLTASRQNAAGNTIVSDPSQLTFTSSDATIATVVYNGDFTATITATGALGVATITASYAGLTATDEVTVVADETGVQLVLVADLSVSK